MASWEIHSNWCFTRKINENHPINLAFSIAMFDCPRVCKSVWTCLNHIFQKGMILMVPQWHGGRKSHALAPGMALGEFFASHATSTLARTHFDTFMYTHSIILSVHIYIYIVYIYIYYTHILHVYVQLNIHTYTYIYTCTCETHTHTHNCLVLVDLCGAETWRDPLCIYPQRLCVFVSCYFFCSFIPWYFLGAESITCVASHVLLKRRLQMLAPALVALSRCRWPHPENGARPWISTLKRVGTAWNLQTMSPCLFGGFQTIEMGLMGYFHVFQIFFHVFQIFWP